MAKKNYSLAHTKWMCKYHIVFISKYRRKIIYNQYRKSMREILNALYKYKEVNTIEGHLMSDYEKDIPTKIMYLNLWDI